MDNLKKLIEKSRRGDRRAQDQLILKVQNRVYYHCRKILSNEEDALDATQDILIAMLAVAQSDHRQYLLQAPPGHPGAAFPGAGYDAAGL